MNNAPNNIKNILINIIYYIHKAPKISKNGFLAYNKSPKMILMAKNPLTPHEFNLKNISNENEAMN